MPFYEYKVIPAPRRGEKTRAAKTTAERFAHAMSMVMNELGREGWEYLRADTLPCEERVGLTGKTTAFQNVLVFRRAVETAEDIIVPPASVSLTIDAPEGPAPRLSALAPEPAAVPALGPARPDGMAAE
ncbi:MAG: DUF4177 domain-containing protein [Cereibacter sphaeroides]|uniref:DUF4177 domain-containing protein n=1 Tax=Cereibacter sphaeroides TaxID=1063 RepID=A0A2W5SA06_CERSP|nr:MAG: DUF4177 domain-containing protein [Cereibacter sphaeroides]